MHIDVVLEVDLWRDWGDDGLFYLRLPLPGGGSLMLSERTIATIAPSIPGFLADAARRRRKPTA
jgi:hypothetical protein